MVQGTLLFLLEKGFKVTGIDFSEKMIEIAKKKVPQGKFIVMDVKELKEPKMEFDAILTKAFFYIFQKRRPKRLLKILVKNW